MIPIMLASPCRVQKVIISRFRFIRRSISSPTYYYNNNNRIISFSHENNNKRWFENNNNKRYFASSVNNNITEEEKGRIPINDDLSLDDKIKQFVDVPIGKLNRLDLFLKSDDIMLESCKLGTVEGMEQAEQILKRMILEKKHSSTENNLKISSNYFEKVMFGWGKLQNASAIEKMRNLLKFMKKEYEYDLNNNNNSDSISSEDDDNDDSSDDIRIISRSSCEPTIYTYNTILQAMEKTALRDTNIAFEAERLLIEMIEKSNNNTTNDSTTTNIIKPNNRSFTHVIRAQGNTKLSGAGDRAERILRSMEEMHKREKELYKIKFGEEYDVNEPWMNKHNIVTPDGRVYSAVIEAICYSDRRGSCDRAGAVMRKLLGRGSKLDMRVYITLLLGYSRLAGTYSSNPRARFEAAGKAEEVALMLLDEYDSICDIENEDIEGYEDNIEDYWKKQLTIAFNIVVNAWARSDVIEAGIRADSLWQRMLSEPMLQPDKITMNATIKSWARAFDPVKAEETLNFVLDLYEEGHLEDNDNNVSMKPDAISYSTVITAWAKSNHSDKTANARRLLDTMLQKHEEGEDNMKPNIISFTAVINAAGYSPKDDNNNPEDDAFGVKDSYNIAMETYEEILNDTYQLGGRLAPDSFVFAAMLKVIQTHTLKGEDRYIMIQRIFDDACAAGQVSSLVIKQLRSVCGDDKILLARLLGGQELAEHLSTIYKLPHEWIKNVPKQAKFCNVDNNNDNKKKRRENNNKR